MVKYCRKLNSRQCRIGLNTEKNSEKYVSISSPTMVMQVSRELRNLRDSNVNLYTQLFISPDLATKQSSLHAEHDSSLKLGLECWKKIFIVLLILHY